MDVIKLHNKGVSSRKLSAEFKCSKTQIGNIIRQKDTILAKWTEGINPKAKYVNPRYMVYTDLDKKCFEWFCIAKDLGYVVTGPLILEQANIFALEMALMTSPDPLADLMPSRSNTESSSPTSVGRVQMCQLQSLRTTINPIQISAKATTHVTFSMLVRVACSTVIYKQNHWCNMMTTDMGAKGRSTGSTSP